MSIGQLLLYILDGIACVASLWSTWCFFFAAVVAPWAAARTGKDVPVMSSLINSVIYAAGAIGWWYVRTHGVITP